MKNLVYKDYMKIMYDWMNGGVLDIKKILKVVDELERYDA